VIDRDDIKRIWDDIKVNHKKLDECIGPHEFGKKDKNHKRTCVKCGGRVDFINANWYERGLRDGKSV
jgi:hypothetical protein